MGGLRRIGHDAELPGSFAQVTSGIGTPLRDDSRENAPLRDGELAHRARRGSSQAYGRHRYIAAGQS